MKDILATVTTTYIIFNTKIKEEDLQSAYEKFKEQLNDPGTFFTTDGVLVHVNPEFLISIELQYMETDKVPEPEEPARNIGFKPPEEPEGVYKNGANAFTYNVEFLGHKLNVNGILYRTNDKHFWTILKINDQPAHDVIDSKHFKRLIADIVSTNNIKGYHVPVIPADINITDLPRVIDYLKEFSEKHGCEYKNAKVWYAWKEEDNGTM